MIEKFKNYFAKLEKLSIAELDRSAAKLVIAERTHARGEYQREHRAPDGTRCWSRTGLQIEHVRPFAIYRTHDERFLRLLCRAQNRSAAERVYGAAFSQRKIDERRTVSRE